MGKWALAHGKDVDVVKHRLSKWKRVICEFSSSNADIKITKMESDAKKRLFFNVSQDEGSEVVPLAKRFLPGTTDKVIVETMEVAKL